MHMHMHVHNGFMSRLPACSWLYVPAASGPIGGGLIKLGHGGTAAAVTVAVAPYAACALLYAVFVVGYLGALVRYLCAGTAGQQAMERLIATSANAVVAILTLSVVPLGHASDQEADAEAAGTLRRAPAASDAGQAAQR